MTNKLVRAVVYLQNYHSGINEHINDFLQFCAVKIKNESTWKVAEAFIDDDQNFPDFQLKKLIRECQNKSIDVILTSSISKFGGSLKKSIEIINDLIAKDIRIIFLEDDIDSSSPSDQDILEKLKRTVEVENRLLSIHKKWSFDKKIEQDAPFFARILGYNRVDGKWVIIPEEAALVRKVFKLYLDGKTPLEISRSFIDEKHKKVNGRIDWTSTAIKSILANERYTGDVLCRKSLIKGYSSGGIKKEQYLIKNHHKPIISRKDFEMANAILNGVGTETKRYSRNNYPLSTRFKCNICSSNFQRYQNRYSIFWRCGNHIKSKSLCPMTSVKEERVKKVLIKAFFEKFDPLTNSIDRLIDFLEQAEIYKEDKITPLSDKIDKLIKKENSLALEGSHHGLEKVKLDKEKAELIMLNCSKTINLIEKDYPIRSSAISTLQDLVDNDKYSTNTLRVALDDLWFLRAFFISVSAHSDYSYEIHWIDDDVSQIELDTED